MPAPVTETEVRGADWYGEDLSGQEHTRVAFIGLDLSEATDDSAVFTECTFLDCRFNLSRHTDAAFLNCTFSSCSFFQAEFTACKFVGSAFDRCSFDLVTVDGGDWSFVAIPGADLTKATFTGTRMREADLTRADIENAEAVFLCNAVRGILPVRQLAQRQWLPDAGIEQIRRKLAQALPAFSFQEH